VRWTVQRKIIGARALYEVNALDRMFSIP